MTRPAALLAALAVLLLASADPSGAATLSGTFKKAVGKRVVVVLPGGTGKTAKVPANGKVSIAGLTLDGASVHLVNADGSYFGPVVLGRSKNGRKAYAAIKGSAKLALGAVTPTAMAFRRSSTSTTMATSSSTTSIAPRAAPRVPQSALRRATAAGRRRCLPAAARARLSRPGSSCSPTSS